MGKTKRTRDAIYLDPAKFVLLVELSQSTRIARAALLREAVDDLLSKHGMLKRARLKP